MPTLILICGVPRSGKTFIAHELRDIILETQTKIQSVTVVTDFDTAITSTTSATSSDEQKQQDKPTRQSLYSEFKSEKKTRAQLRTSVERALSTPKSIVIVDSLNYIKGFRYELYCVAKTASASYGVIHANASFETCISRDNCDDEDKWGEELNKALNNRFEEPQARNRWDSPLFTIDTTENTSITETLKSVVDSIFNTKGGKKGRRGGSKKLVASMATRYNISPGVDAVANIDRVTRSAENTLVDFIQSSNSPLIGSSVEIPDASMPVRLQRWPNIKELRDMRRAFLSYSRMYPPSDDHNSSVLDSYVSYINEQLTVRRD